MGPSTRALLAEVGIPPASTCLDVGCGGGDVTFELARAVGPSGRVLEVDRDQTKLDIAKREAALESFNRGDIQPDLSDGRCPLWPAIIDNQP